MSSVLQVQQLYTVGIPLLEAYLLPMANNRTTKNVSHKNKMAASHVVRMHVFHRVKKWPTYHVAVPTGNALASQQSIFRENRFTHR